MTVNTTTDTTARYIVYEWRQSPDGNDHYATLGAHLTSTQAAMVLTERYHRLLARGYVIEDLVYHRSFNAFLHCRSGGAFRVKLYVEQIPIPLSVTYDY